MLSKGLTEGHLNKTGEVVSPAGYLGIAFQETEQPVLRLEQRAWGFGGMAKIAGGLMSRGNMGQVGGAGGAQREASALGLLPVSTLAFPLGKGKMWEALGRALRGDSRNRGR